MRQVFLFAAMLMALWACEEPFKLDLDQAPSRIVIEGLLTDKPHLQMVRVTRSSGFYSSGGSTRIADAMVSVTDDEGNTVLYTHNPRNHADSAGIYLPPAGFRGDIGRTYRLSVEADNQVYEASAKLLPVLKMDSLAYKVQAEEQEDPEVAGRFYEVLVFAREPQNEDNFYLFKFFRNDSLTRSLDTDVYFADDAFLGENIDGVEAPVFFSRGDTARVEIYSLSREGYIFYSDLSVLLNNDAGGMFGPIPASPRTNLTNDALGYFQVSAVDISGIRIE